jgi:predicted ATPase
MMSSSESKSTSTSTSTSTATVATAATATYSELSEAERNLVDSNNKAPLYKFVMTGGPCGGKTTALARVFNFLRERGFEVITCPEAYTLLSSNGMSVDFFSTGGMGRIMQGSVMDVQRALEDAVQRVLKARGRPGVVLCDRGTMDGTVYISKEDFAKVMEERGTDMVQLRDNRYDAIFHLVTCADGAAHAYTLENNKVRTETPQEAIAVDRKTQNAWVGHPHLYVIDNSTDFEGKMNRLVDVISKIVGLPSNLKRRSAKFLLRGKPDLSAFPAEIGFQIFEVEKVYLQQSRDSENKKENYGFIRRRTNVGIDGSLLGSVYQLTTVQRADDEMIEQKRIISQREYVASYNTRDLDRHVVVQRRISFLYNHQSFAIHMYEEPVADLCILHAQVEASKDGDGEPQVDLPPFLNVERRIYNTKEDEKNFGAFSLSLISNKSSPSSRFSSFRGQSDDS